MEYIWSLLAIVVVLSVILYLKKKKHLVVEDNPETYNSSPILATSKNEPFNEKMDIILGELNQRDVDESQLLEITDSSMLSHISSLIPVMINESASFLNKPKLPAGGLYEVVIPKGAVLTNSTEMVGASRGFFRGPDGIAGHANLVPVELGSKLGDVMGTVSSMMNIASIFVGQYYMSEINSRLQTIEDEIKSVSNFQKNEFESKVITSITHVMEMSKYSTEIVRSDEVRLSKLTTIESLKREMTQLVEQLLLQIKEGLVMLDKKKVDEYEKRSKELDRQVKLLVGLMMAFQELSNIELVLGKGGRSKELAFSMYYTEEEKVVNLFAEIEKWHSAHTDLYEIDLDNSRRLKVGLRKTVGSIQGLFDENKKYETLDYQFTQVLRKQLNLSMQQPVMIESSEKVRIVYNQKESKSYIAID